MQAKSGCRRSTSAFNEAPIHESGKCCGKVQQRWVLHPFNEAPIHESGKLHPDVVVRARRIAFNEAPIHESGKFCLDRIADSLPVPSMRPRFMNRGSMPSINTWISAFQPFNEAPIHESGKSRCAHHRLLGERPVPSMRPRFMNRGSLVEHGLDTGLHVPLQ